MDDSHAVSIFHRLQNSRCALSWIVSGTAQPTTHLGLEGSAQAGDGAINAVAIGCHGRQHVRDRPLDEHAADHAERSSLGQRLAQRRQDEVVSAPSAVGGAEATHSSRSASSSLIRFASAESSLRCERNAAVNCASLGRSEDAMTELSGRSATWAAAQAEARAERSQVTCGSFAESSETWTRFELAVASSSDG